MTPVKVEEKYHSPLGASQAYRWIPCPGSVALIAKLVEQYGDRVNSAGREADLGTAAHSLAEDCLSAEPRADAWEGLGRVYHVNGEDFEADGEMVDSVQVLLDLVDRLMEEHADRKPLIYTEVSMSSPTHKLASGTADVVIVVPNHKIIVIDYKNGVHVNVEPSSDQNHYYARLALEHSDFPYIYTVKEVDLYIVQPRQPHPKGPVRKFTTTPRELRNWWSATVLPAMKRTEDPNAPLVVGEHCRFCPAKLNHRCPAIKAETTNFDASLDPAYLTDEELGAAIEKLDALVQTRKDLGAEAYKRAMRGSKIPGQKLVEAKSTRVFRPKLKVTGDDGVERELDLKEELEREFGNERFKPQELRSAPQIEEKCKGGKEFVKRWAYKPKKGLTMAPKSDKRAAARPPMDMDAAPMGSGAEGLAEVIDI